MEIYSVNSEVLKKRDINKNITVIKTIDEKDILKSIKLFNSEINWDNMYDLKTAKNRIEIGNENFYIGIYQKNIFGYFWIKNIHKNEYLIYNVFSKNFPVDRKYGATDMIYSIISNFNSSIFYAEIDDWNIKSKKVFEKLGFVKYQKFNSFL